MSARMACHPDIYSMGEQRQPTTMATQPLPDVAKPSTLTLPGLAACLAGLEV